MKNQLVLMLFICSLITSIDSADSGSLNVRMSSGYNGISNSVLPECPVLNLPLNGDTLIMQSGIVPINFTTSGDENTTHQWRLYFGTDPNNLANFGGYLVGGNGNVGTAVPVMPGETYYWVVTELNAYGESEKCEIFSFTMTQECPELNLAIGDPCDDGNDDTFNDIVFPDCVCVGEIPDADNDGILDGMDNCILTWNVNQSDFDGDGIGDVCDSDIDGDGIENMVDCSPYNQLIFEGASCDDGNPLSYEDYYTIDCICLGYLDADLDGIPDDMDNCPLISNPMQEDGDGDGIGDICDNDMDGDGFPNDEDCDPFVSEIHEGSGCDDGDPFTSGDILNAQCFCEGFPLDSDLDGIEDIFDNCIEVPNPGQQDFDGDLIGDDCDSDIDNDGSPNLEDCDAYDAGLYVGAPCDDGNQYTKDDMITFACICEGKIIDTDEDGIENHLDNCADIFNTDQSDIDNDGIGDVCDNDIDGDGELNGVDCDAYDSSIYEGASCDDGDVNTINDVILNDCSCLGSPVDNCTASNVVNCGDVITNNTNNGELESSIPYCDVFLGYEVGVWYKFIGQGEFVRLDIADSNFDTELAVFSGDCSELNCVIGNDDFNGTLRSRVEFFAVPEVNYFIYVTGFFAGAGDFTMNVTCDQTADNAVCNNAESINEGVVLNAQIDGGLGSSESCFYNGDNSLWYKYTATQTGNCVISSAIDPDEPDTRLSVFQGSCSGLVCLYGSDDISSTNYTSEVSFAVQSGQKYFVEWDDRWSSEPFDFEISVTSFDCPILLGNYGDSCDDGDPLTDNDVVHNDCTCSGVISCNTRDKLILETCYNVWGGSETNLNWDFSNYEPVTDAWTGISVDPNSGCVTKIVLKSKGLQGYLPEDLSQLTELTQLRITRNNELGGELPASIPSLPYLSDVNLRKNNITGCIPDSWGAFCLSGTLVSIQGNPNWNIDSFFWFCWSGIGGCNSEIIDDEQISDLDKAITDEPWETSVTIYPNPNVGDQLYIAFEEHEYEKTEEAFIIITNLYGQQVAHDRVVIGAGRVTHVLDFQNHLSSGVYMVLIEINGTIQAKRLIIE